MICASCFTAANKKKTMAAKKRWHAKCKGPAFCFCQHKVGPREKFIRKGA